VRLGGKEFGDKEKYNLIKQKLMPSKKKIIS
jgi:hypothetical protein